MSEPMDPANGVSEDAPEGADVAEYRRAARERIWGADNAPIDVLYDPRGPEYATKNLDPEFGKESTAEEREWFRQQQQAKRKDKKSD